MTNETVEPEVKEVAFKPARQRGVLLLKFWGGVYACIIIGYLFFQVTGSQTKLSSQLQAGDRLWKNEVFMAQGEQIKFGAGDTISASALKIIQAASPESVEVSVYGSRWIYHIPYPFLMGLMNFIGLVLVLYIFLGDALPSYLESFCQTVHTDLAEARAAKAEAAKLQNQREAMERELQEEESRQLAAAQEEAKVVHEYILKHQQEQADRYLKGLEHHLGAEIHSAAEKLKVDVVHQAVDLARELLRSRVNDNLQDQMIREFCRDLKETPLS